MRKQNSLAFCLVLFSLLFYASCRKTDFGAPAEKPTSIDRFFNVPESADPRLKSIVRSIKAQEKEHPFLEKFIRKTGWPVWAKAKVIANNNLNGGRESTVDSSALVYVPFVQDNAIVVSAALAVRMNETDTAWRVLYPSHYESFGFGATANGDWNARNVFQFFALFQYDIFGHTKFLIKDSRLFNTTTDSSMVTLKERNGVALNGRTSRTMEWHETTECLTLTYCTNWVAARNSSITDGCYDVIFNIWLTQNGYSNPESLFKGLMLDNAYGTVVNCDYFPIKITVLPTINGVQLTPQQVFEHFRNNINTLINTNIAQFEAYNAFGINDAIVWNAPNPFTALVHIDMVDDGTVIISDYQLSTNSSRMKASTLVSPLDMTHPVSGTREWGIQPDPNGGWFFYTTAVDRLTTKVSQIVDNLITIFSGSSALTQGDDLWKSLQEKMMLWINANGGQAQLYSNNYVTARPDFSAVREFLLNQIDLPTMRQRIGCP